MGSPITRALATPRRWAATTPSPPASASTRNHGRGRSNTTTCHDVAYGKGW